MITGRSIKQKKEISLRTRLVISFSVLGFVVVGLSLVLNYINLRQQLRADLRQRLLNIVSIAALQQNGDAFINIQSPQDPAFDQIRLQNLKIRNSDPDLRFVYTMRYDENGIYFVVDAVVPGEVGGSPYGTRYLEPGPILAANYKTMAQPIVETTFYTDEYGTFISAYAPFYTSAGKVAGIIGADITANKVLTRENQIVFWYVVIFLISLPVIAGIGWLFGNALTAPIIKLTQVAAHMADGELSYRPDFNANSTELDKLVQAFYSMADQLKSLITGLEQRVSERTQALERRAIQLQAASDIGTASTRVRDVNILLSQAVELISTRFGYYHAGIFLVDDQKEYAVLRAANSEGGQRMLARGHKLKIGQTGIVGFVTDKGQARIALDVGKDAVFFDNPDLPDTRSEMALPLSAGGNILGALDVQSTKEAAFSEEDISTLRVLADQIAIAIENAYLFAENQRSLYAAQRAYGEISRKGWQRLLDERTTDIGFLSRTDDQVTQVTGKNNPEFLLAFKDGKPVLAENGKSLFLPIMAQGQTIGAIHLDKPESSNAWTAEDIALANQLAEQLGTALESARLYNDIRERGERESAISTITTKINSSTQLETILRTAVEQLGITLGNSEVILRLGSQLDGIKINENRS